MATLPAAIKSSLTLKVCFIGCLVLVLLVPMGMIEDITGERGHLYRQANTEITNIWGGGHMFTGPVLTIPRLETERQNAGWIQDPRFHHLPPESLAIHARFETQVRYRGIFKVPVYTARISSSGRFKLPAQTAPDSAGEVLLQVPFSGSKSLKRMPVLYWNGEALELSAVADSTEREAVIFQASILPVDVEDAEFELVYETAGSAEFNLHSWAKQTSLEIESNWGSPGFQGGFFPVAYTVREDGFDATWNINNIFTNAEDNPGELVTIEQFRNLESFGVKFVQLADTYQLVTRSTKYAVLFIGLTFLVYFLAEIIAGTRLHVIHYLLIGLANCIFYLLLLSLSEHISFDLAYLASAFGSTLLISLYGKSIMASSRRGWLVFAILSGLYLYLYTALVSEGFALLIGSIGLFFIMALFMYLTRNINWHTDAIKQQD